MSFLCSLARSQEISRIGRRGIHCMQKLCAEKISGESLETAQNRVIDAALTLVRENARLKASLQESNRELVQSFGGAVATSTLLGVPLGHNSSYLEGPAFAPPFIRDGIWSASANSTTEEGKDLADLRVLADVGNIPVQEIRDCGIEDERLMKIVSDSVKIVMDEDPLRPLVLGGDHSISFPVVRAISEKLGGQVDILHFDAHPDLYEAFEGNYYSHASPFARIMEGGYARRLLQAILYSFTILSINKEGREQAQRFGVEQYEMRTFDKDRAFLENLQLGEGVKGVYISIDVDCLDPGYAPGVSHYESGGLSFRNVMNILQNLKGDIVGGDVVEYNPQRDTADDMTAMVAAKFVRELAAVMSK
ncbi:Arginase, partial [Mucuna pruriens]